MATAGAMAHCLARVNGKLSTAAEMGCMVIERGNVSSTTSYLSRCKLVVPEWIALAPRTRPQQPPMLGLCGRRGAQKRVKLVPSSLKATRKYAADGSNTSTNFPKTSEFSTPPAKPLKATSRELVLLLLVSMGATAVACFRHVSVAGLIDDTEPLFAEAARQMALTGDWTTPQFNAQPRFDKPPLSYWLMALSLLLRGGSALDLAATSAAPAMSASGAQRLVSALRLPSALAALVTCLATGFMVLRFGVCIPQVQKSSGVVTERAVLRSGQRSTGHSSNSSSSDSSSSDSSSSNSGRGDGVAASSLVRATASFSPEQLVPSLLGFLSPWVGSLQNVAPALTAASAFALNLGTVVWGSTALSDMLLCCTISCSLFSFFSAFAYAPSQPTKSRILTFNAAFFSALAVLTKGPIGLLLPALIILSFLAVAHSLDSLLDSSLPTVPAAAFGALLCTPWFLRMWQLHGSMYVDTFFGYHNLERFTRGVNHHGGRPFWFGAAAVMAMFFPWSLSLPRALLLIRPWSPADLKTWRGMPRQQQLPLFAAVWALVTFAFFSLSRSQLPSYYLPMAPSVAILAACAMSRPRRWRKRRNEEEEEGRAVEETSDGLHESVLAQKQTEAQGSLEHAAATHDLMAHEAAGYSSAPAESRHGLATVPIGRPERHWLQAAVYGSLAAGFGRLPAILLTSPDPKAASIGLALQGEGLHARAAIIFGATALLLAWHKGDTQIHLVPGLSCSEPGPAGDLPNLSGAPPSDRSSPTNAIHWSVPATSSSESMLASLKNPLPNRPVSVLSMTLSSLHGVFDLLTQASAAFLHAAGMLLFFALFFRPTLRIADSVLQGSARQVALSAGQQQQPGEPIVMLGVRMPSVVFYSSRPVAFFEDVDEAAEVLKLLTAEARGGHQGPKVKRVVAVAERECLQSLLPLLPLKHEVLDEAGDYQLVRLILSE